MNMKQKERHASYQRNWRKEHPSRSREVVSESRARRAARNREIVDTEKAGSPCSDCGRSFPAVCMDFHHLADKKDNISRLINRAASVERLKEEMSKCILLCANCHRIRHHG